MKGRIRTKSPLLLLLVVTLIISILSYYMHSPTTPPVLDNIGLNYNDIVYGVFNPIFRDIVNPDGSFKPSNRWFNHNVAERLVTTERLCPKPYIDYKFEYPPIVGAVWFLSTCIAINSILPEKYDGLTYFQLVERVAETHYQIQSIVLIASLIISIVYAYKISAIINSSWKRILLFILLPSTTLYLIYNWDAIALMFIIASLYYLLCRRYTLSSILLGLSISTKLLPVLFAIILVYDLIQKQRKNCEYNTILLRTVLGLVIAGLIPYILILAISFNGFIQFVNHHLTWYCENCIYMYITRDAWAPYNRIYAMVAITLSILVLSAIDIDYSNQREVLLLALVSLIVATTLNYVFSPQMMIMLTLVATLVLNLRQLCFLTIADIANFGIMALFFKDLDARIFINNLIGVGMDVKYSPWTPDSPVQLIAMVRNVILILIAIEVLYGIAKSKER